jgi:hypothetical protein
MNKYFKSIGLKGRQIISLLWAPAYLGPAVPFVIPLEYKSSEISLLIWAVMALRFIFPLATASLTRNPARRSQ